MFKYLKEKINPILKSKHLRIVGILSLVVAIPLTIIFAKSQQNFKSQAYHGDKITQTVECTSKSTIRINVTSAPSDELNQEFQVDVGKDASSARKVGIAKPNATTSFSTFLDPATPEANSPIPNIDQMIWYRTGDIYNIPRPLPAIDCSKYVETPREIKSSVYKLGIYFEITCDTDARLWVYGQNTDISNTPQEVWINGVKKDPIIPDGGGNIVGIDSNGASTYGVKYPVTPGTGNIAEVIFDDNSGKESIFVACIPTPEPTITPTPTASLSPTVSPSPTPIPLPGKVSGYRLFAKDGGVFDFGAGKSHLGSAPAGSGIIVSMASTPSGQGYWMAASDGGVYAFGDAKLHGSLRGTTLKKPIVGLAATPSGKGYWLVASDGGMFAYGDAAFKGSLGSTVLNQPIVGISSTPSGQGYWLIASDGGIFAYGDAGFFGSLGNTKLNQPIVDIAATPSGKGYWLVASDGGMFAYGDAGFFGSLGNTKLNQPIVGMLPTPSGKGYWLVASDGGMFAYGDAGFFGSLGNTKLNQPIAGMSL